MSHGMMKMNPHNIPLIVKHGQFRTKSKRCINCEKEFTPNEEIISKQTNHHRSYYCLDCAKRVYVI